MAYLSKDSDGNITGVYANPQPDAIDGEGNIVKGRDTVEVPDDDPAVIAFFNRPRIVPEPTKAELIMQIQSLLQKVEALP